MKNLHFSDIEHLPKIYVEITTTTLPCRFFLTYLEKIQQVYD